MDIGTLVAHLKIDDKQLKAAAARVDTLSGHLTKIGKISAFAGLAGGAIGLAAASKGAAGAVLALPAAAALAGGAFAALKVGTSGVGDALKALADGDAAKAGEALAKLSPNARLAVTAFDGVRKSYAAVKTATQDALFAGLGEQVKSLGGQYLPILKAGLSSNAAALNMWAQSGIQAAKSPFVSGAVNNILGQSAGIMAQSSGAAGSLVTILAALAQAGMPLLQQGAAFVTRFLATKAAFLSSAQGAAWLTAKVNLARTILAALGTIARNIMTILGGMFTAATSSGNQLLGTLVRLTTQAAQWASSAEGQKQLTDVFNLLGQVLQNLLIILPPISGAFMALMGFLASLPAPVQSVVTGFGSFALVAGMLLPKVMGLVTTLKAVGTAVSTGASAITLAAARWGLMGTAAATSATTQNASALRIVGSWLMMAARSTASALVTAAAWTLSTAGAAAAAVGRMVAAAALMVAQWAMMAAGAMARAVIMAASWLVAMGPIGWVIAIVIGLVALVIANWDRVKAFTVAAWAAVSGAVAAAWAAIKAWCINALLSVVTFILSSWARAKAITVSALAAMRGAVSSGISAVVGFVRSLPGKILSALSRLGSLLVGLGGDMVRGLWNGISAGWSWLTGMVKGLASRLLNAAKSALGIGSPSKEFAREVGRWIPAGIDVGVVANTKRAVKGVTAMGARIVDAGRAAVSGGSVRAAVSASSAASSPTLDLSDGALDRLAATLRASPPVVELDGKKVTRGVQRREQLERRLVAGSAR